MTGITLLGLGPGHPRYLTCQAREFLGSCSELYALEPNHPVLIAMAIKARTICPDVALEEGLDDVARYRQVADQLINLASRPEGVSLAVTGHPGLDYPGIREVIDEAEARGMPVHMIPGLSLVDLVIQLVGLPERSLLTIVDAEMLSKRHVPTFPPTAAVVINRLESAEKAGRLRDVLGSIYPDEHPLILVDASKDDGNDHV